MATPKKRGARPDGKWRVVRSVGCASEILPHRKSLCSPSGALFAGSVRCGFPSHSQAAGSWGEKGIPKAKNRAFYAKSNGSLSLPKPSYHCLPVWAQQEPPGRNRVAHTEVL